MAPASTPARVSCLASRPAPCLVRTKNRVRSGRAAISAAIATLSSAGSTNTWWSAATPGSVTGAMACSAGSDRYLVTSRSTSRSRVAENSSRWPPGGVASSSWVTAGMKPRSAMWSASSSTAISTWPRLAARRSIRSMSRPGVATTTSTPRASCSICRPIGAPPYTVVTRTPSRRPSGASTSATWRASSRVGTRTSPRGALGWRGPAAWASRASRGRPKARVLPEPVSARPSTSRPASASGSARAWMAKGAVMPCSPSAATSGPGRPSSANVAGAGAGALSAAVRARSSSDTTGVRGEAGRCGRPW